MLAYIKVLFNSLEKSVKTGKSKRGRKEIKRCVRILILCSVALSFFLHVSTIKAEKNKEPKVLVIYSSLTGEIDEHQRSLDMVVSHFTTDVTFINSHDVTRDDLIDVSHLVYYGQVPESLSDRFASLFDGFTEKFIAIGFNSEQLGERFSFVTPIRGQGVDNLTLTKDKSKKIESISPAIIDIELEAGGEVIIEGRNKEGSTTSPVMVKKGNHYFYGVSILWSQELPLFGEALHEFFEIEHEAKHPAYIRLEDVHPLVDDQNMKDIATVLKEKNIPYMVAVIPVYTDPQTGEEYHFSDSPKLLKILKEIQQDGGSIVLHGYTHQFRSSETGEGFEFWDVENNTPIYAQADEVFKLKEESEFPSISAYERYIKQLKQFEREYIEMKLTTGIQELVNYGIYPLAFEAPHYTMSQHGYQIASEYFSTYVGQVQLSDEDWEIMDSTPYITTPTFLHGMELLPETMGYVRPKNLKDINKMIDRAKNISMTKDGIVAGFYHPYLGVEGFKELIHEMEKLPNIEWIDLKERDLWVEADKVRISTENGEIIVDAKRGKIAASSLDFFLYHLFRLLSFLSWGMVILGSTATIIFIVFTFANTIRRRVGEGK